jgi:hypothetical protein
MNDMSKYEVYPGVCEICSFGLTCEDCDYCLCPDECGCDSCKFVYLRRLMSSSNQVIHSRFVSTSSYL